MKRIRCECPSESVGIMPESWYAPEELKARVHAPGKCRGNHDLARYQRGDRVLVLCSACCLPGDDERIDA